MKSFEEALGDLMREQFALVISRQRAAAVDGVDLFLRESNFKSVAALSSPRVVGAPEPRHGQRDDLLFAGGQGAVGDTGSCVLDVLHQFGIADIGPEWPAMRLAVGFGRVDHGALFIIHFVGRQNGNACHWIFPCFYTAWQRYLRQLIMTAIAAVAITTR